MYQRPKWLIKLSRYTSIPLEHIVKRSILVYLIFTLFQKSITRINLTSDSPDDTNGWFAKVGPVYLSRTGKNMGWGGGGSVL